MTREPPLWQTLQEPMAAKVVMLEAEVERLQHDWAIACRDLGEARAEVERLTAVIRWAIGEAPDADGNWFADVRPPLEAKYWWRQNLRDALRHKP
jgi:hypothetical protein